MTAPIKRVCAAKEQVATTVSRFEGQQRLLGAGTPLSTTVRQLQGHKKRVEEALDALEAASTIKDVDGNFVDAQVCISVDARRAQAAVSVVRLLAAVETSDAKALEAELLSFSKELEHMWVEDAASQAQAALYLEPFKAVAADESLFTGLQYGLMFVKLVVNATSGALKLEG